jgi:hypothetical protein
MLASDTTIKKIEKKKEDKTLICKGNFVKKLTLINQICTKEIPTSSPNIKEFFFFFSFIATL